MVLSSCSNDAKYGGHSGPPNTSSAKVFRSGRLAGLGLSPGLPEGEGAPGLAGDFMVLASPSVPTAPAASEGRAPPLSLSIGAPSMNDPLRQKLQDTVSDFF